MCTVTILPWRGGVRLVHNRDERRSRPAGLPPRVVRIEGGRAVMPIDPVSGGTWVAVNDVGLAFALLNVNPLVPRPPKGTRSRGTVIPDVVSSGEIEEFRRRFLDLPLGEHPPFRLLAAGRGELVSWTVQGAEILEVRSVLDRPVMFTSSGLGDHLVEGPRRRLFQRLLAAGAGPEAQDGFHRHSWAGRPELSVWMSRADACTVSQTTVEAAEGRVRMTYRTTRGHALHQPARSASEGEAPALARASGWCAPRPPPGEAHP